MLKNMHCLGLGHFIEFLPVNLENVRLIITSGVRISAKYKWILLSILTERVRLAVPFLVHDFVDLKGSFCEVPWDLFFFVATALVISWSGQS